MSLDLRQFAGGRPDGSQPQQIVLGRVSQRRPAPASATDTLWVVIPSISIGQSIPFKLWPLSHGDTNLPAHGDSVILAYDENGLPHVICWGV